MILQKNVLKKVGFGITAYFHYTAEGEFCFEKARSGCQMSADDYTGQHYTAGADYSLYRSRNMA